MSENRIPDLPGYFSDDNTLYVIGVRNNGPSGHVGALEVNTSGRESSHVYLTRAEARQVIEALQRILADADPEPFDVERVEVGDEILATDAEKLPIGSQVRIPNICTYTVVAANAHGDALQFDAQTDDRMRGKQGVRVTVDRIGPETLVEPECDYLVDAEGDNWVRSDDSDHWTCGATRLPLAQLLAFFGPLVPHRRVITTEAMPVIEQVA